MMVLFQAGLVEDVCANTDVSGFIETLGPVILPLLLVLLGLRLWKAVAG